MLALVLPATSPAAALRTQPRSLWQPNGQVNAVAADAATGRVFVGGKFDYVGPTTGSSVQFDVATGVRATAWPEFDGGDVNRIVADGSGGWFVGGSFTTVDGAARPLLVRVLADGTVDPNFTPSLPSVTTVRALAVAGGKVYVGGTSSVAATGALVRLDAATGAPDSWARPVAGTGTIAVNDLVVDGGYVWAVGRFDTYNGSARRNVARLDMTTGTDSTIGPAGGAGGSATDNIVDAELRGTTLYVGGEFSTVGSVTSKSIAGIDTGNGNVSVVWSSGLSAVTALTSDGTYLYAAAGASIKRFVLGATTPTGWITAPGIVSGTAASLVIQGSVLYAAGDMATANARRLLRFDVTSGAELSMSTRFSGPVRALAFNGGTALVGGSFNSAGGVYRTNLAALSLRTGTATGWAPVAPDEVWGLDTFNNVVYVGGGSSIGFVRAYDAIVGGDAVGFVAPTFMNTGRVEDVAWVPGAGQLLVGGSFDGVAGVAAHRGLVALNPFGAVTGTWAGTVGTVLDLQRTPNGLDAYVAGSYSDLLGSGQGRIARLHWTGSTFAVDGSFAPTVTGFVSDVAVEPTTGNGVYLAGGFNVNAAAGSLVRLPVTAGAGTGPDWSVSSGGAVAAVDVNQGMAFAGGTFTTLAGVGSTRLGAVEITSSTNVWSPAVPSWSQAAGFTSVVSLANTVIAAGPNGVAAFTYDTDDTPPHVEVTGIDEPAPGDPSDSVAVSGRTVFVRTSAGAAPRFTVKSRAWDTYDKAAASSLDVSGIAKVNWPAVPGARGTWTGAGNVVGSSTGLITDCWKASDPGSNNYLGSTIDTAIDYEEGTARPDVLPQLPAQMAQLGGFPPVSGEYDSLSCAWRGTVVPPNDVAAPTIGIRNRADQGSRADIGGVHRTAPITDPNWPTFDDWTLSSFLSPEVQVPFATDGPEPLKFQWWEGSGSSFAVLEWDLDDNNSFNTIPEGAFVTNVAYQREYRFVGPSAASTGTSTIAVGATDRASHPAPTDQFTVVTDEDPPASATVTSSTGLTTSASTISISVTDSGDPVSGIFSRKLEMSSVPFAAPGACDTLAPSANTWSPVGPSYPGAASTHVENVPLATGCYRFRYVSTDNVGNVRINGLNGDDALANWIMVDTSPPAGGSVNYAGGWTKQPTVTINATLPTDPDSGIPTPQLQLQRTTAPIVQGICGAWNASWTSRPWSPAATTTESLSDVDGMCVHYRLSATNGVGTEVIWGPGAVLMVDRSLPTIASYVVGSPNRGVVAFNGSWTDAAGKAGSTASVTVTPIPTTMPTCQLDSDTDWSCTWDTTNVVDGSYSGVVKIIDPAGNTGTRSFLVELDNTRPQLLPALQSSGPDQWQAVAGAPIYVNTTAGGNATVSLGAMDLGSGLAGTSVTASAPWSWSPTVADVGTLAWAAGAPQQALPMSATDVAGNTQLQALDVRVDTAAPAGFDAVYTGGVQQGSAPSITLVTGDDGAGASAGSGVASAVLQRQLNGQLDCLGSWSLPANVQTWSAPPVTLPGTFTDPTVASGACYRYQLVVTDHVGNVATISVPGTFRTDTKGIEVQVVGGASTVAEGGSVVAKVRLRAKPTGTVQLTVAGDSELGVSVTTLQFTPLTWTSWQDVTLTSPSDQRDEPNANGVVTWTVDQAATVDPEYDAVGALSWMLTVLDDDVPAVVVTPPAIGLAVAEPGTSAAYNVTLATQPYGTVTVTPAIASQATVSPSSVTFTASDWSSPHPVTVTALDDPDVDGPQVVTLTHAVSASNAGDAGYSGLAAPSLPVSVSDDDQAAMLVGAPASPTVTEGDAATVPVTVQLRARPSAPVTVAVSSAKGQLAPNTSAVTFTPSDWNVAQTVAVGATDDTLAEPATITDTLRLAPSAGAGGAWGTLAPAAVDMTVRDDDPAKLVKVAGPRWEVDADGHVLLDEVATQGSVLRIHAIGDPRRDVKITADSAPDGQVDVQPASVTIPAGTHDQYVSFSVRALNDRVDEADTHSAKVTFAVTTSDPMYASATVPPVTARITDAPAPTGTTREGTDPNAGGGGGGNGGDPSGGNGGGSYTPPPNDGQPQPNGGQPQPQQPAPGGDTGANPGEVVGDRGVDEKTTVVTEESTTDDETRREKRQARRAKRRGAIQQGAHEVKQWAGENKGKAAVAATATTSAAIWAAKGFGLAGKAMASGGGGMPHPPGLGQLRHLLKRRNRERLNRLRRRWWRGKMRDLDDDDDDWDDFLWGDHAA